MTDENSIIVYELLVECWYDPCCSGNQFMSFKPVDGYSKTLIPWQSGQYRLMFDEACMAADHWNAEHKHSRAIVVERLLQRCY